MSQLLSARYILGADVVANPYHMPLIHAKLTRHLNDFHGIMKDEMWTAFHDHVGRSDSAQFNFASRIYLADTSCLLRVRLLSLDQGSSAEDDDGNYFANK